MNGGIGSADTRRDSMKKNILSAFLVSLLTVIAMACGAPGAEPFDGDPGFDEQLGEEEAVNGQDDNVDEDGGEVDEEEEPGFEGPFCGDAFVDDGEQCDDGNDDDGDGCSSACEVEVFAAEAEGDISIDLVIDDLNSNEAPLEASCTGVIALEVDDGVLVGEGRCFLPANFLDYTLEANVGEDGAVVGEMTVVLNNRPNVLVVAGTLEEGALSLDFDGVTILVGSIRGIWDGTVQADFN
jgi:cysteine-rich repeat protein